MFENVFSVRDPAGLEHLKELTARRRLIEESINETSCITEATAREMSGGLTSHCQQVGYLVLLLSLTCTKIPISIMSPLYSKRNLYSYVYIDSWLTHNQQVLLY